MERKDVKWEEIKEKERELFTLEDQYYQEKKKLDNKALNLDERNANLKKLISEEVDNKKIATETKSTITSINSQMDTAIQGKVRKSLEEKIPNMLLKYDEI